MVAIGRRTRIRCHEAAAEVELIHVAYGYYGTADLFELADQELSAATGSDYADPRRRSANSGLAREAARKARRCMRAVYKKWR